MTDAEVRVAETNSRYPGGCYIGFNAIIDRKAAEQLVQAAAQASQAGFPEVTLCLSSLGGDVDQAFYALNMLRALPIKVHTHAVASISSCTNVVYLAGDRRTASPEATFYFHLTSRPTPPRLFATSAHGVFNSLASDDRRAVDVLTQYASVEEAVAWSWIRGEWTLTAKEAADNGLAHSVEALIIPPGALFTQLVI